MTHRDPFKKLFEDWAKRGSPIPPNASPEERELWVGLAEAERQRAELEADWEAFERDLFGGLEPWQYQFAVGGEIEVERLVFDFLEAERRGAKLLAWPSRDQVQAMRQGLSEIDRLAVSGELDAYQADLRKDLEGTINVESVEAEKRWVMAQLRATRNINKGSEKVKSETDRLARLNFGYRPSKEGDPAQPYSFPKDKRPVMDLLLEDIPEFSPPPGRPKISLPWETPKRQREINYVRTLILRDGLSQAKAAKRAAEATGADKEGNRAKDIAKLFRRKMGLRPPNMGE